MKDVKYKNYEFTIIEIRTYNVLGAGTSEFEAQQEAIERFHRLTKSGDIVCSEVSKPKVVKSERIA